MAGISSEAVAFGQPENKKKFNGIELDKDLELNEYEAQFRDLDPQTARWWQIDPVTDGYENLSPYASMYDNPMKISDPLGNEGEECCPALKGALKAGATIVVAGGGPEDPAADVVAGVVIAGAAIYEVGSWLWDRFHSSSNDQPAHHSNSNSNSNSTNNNNNQSNSKANTTNNSNPPPTKAQERADKLSKTDRSGKDFTPAGKQAVKDVNKEKNNGQTVCENCGTQTQPAQQSKKGVTPPGNETQVDHVDPKAKGGSGTPNNGQVLCRDCNLKKGAN